MFTKGQIIYYAYFDLNQILEGKYLCGATDFLGKQLGRSYIEISKGNEYVVNNKYLFHSFDEAKSNLITNLIDLATFMSKKLKIS